MNEIDPNEAPDGFMAVAPVEDASCAGCVFDSKYGCNFYPGTWCLSHKRCDGKKVIFIKKEKSGNSVPVDKVMIPRAVWDEMVPAIKATGVNL